MTLSFRQAIGWVPETQSTFVRFGLWRREIDEPIAIGCDTDHVFVSALFDEMPVHRKTGIIQTDAVNPVARAS